MNNLGDLVLVLLSSTLAGLRDNLRRDGFEPAACIVERLVDELDDALALGVES